MAAFLQVHEDGLQQTSAAVVYLVWSFVWGGCLLFCLFQFCLVMDNFYVSWEIGNSSEKVLTCFFEIYMCRRVTCSSEAWEEHYSI